MKSIASSRSATVYASVPLLVIAVLLARSAEDPHRTRGRLQQVAGLARSWRDRSDLQCRLREREDPSGRSMRGDVVFVRVVRFTDVTAERVESLAARIDETGPPPG